jgi:HK97 gp10 family phage protein
LADSFTIQLHGGKEAIAAFEELHDYVRGNPFLQAVRSSARMLLQAIYQRAPQGSGRDPHIGRLISNLRIATSRRGGIARGRVVVNTVGKTDDKNNAFYWKFVEYGHRTRNGGGRGFVPPQPFVTPAFEATRNAAAQNVIDEFARAMDRAASRAQRAGR